MARIERARPESTGRADVPQSLEGILSRAMSNRPQDRQASALEFIRDLQSVEEELGLPQTQLEVAMDDWALATAVDPDERTLVRGGQASPDDRSGRRRTRRAAARSSGTAFGADSVTHDGTSGPARPAPPTTRRLVWGISLAAALLVALVGAGIFAVVQGTQGIPVVANVRGSVDGSHVTFTWDDPGIEGGDAYIVTVDGEPSPMQRGARYDTTVEEADRVCATVTVTRDGKSGAPSAERCVDVSAGVG